MALGRGLASLIPPQQNGGDDSQTNFSNQKNESQDAFISEPKKVSYENDLAANRKFSDSVFLIEVEKIKPNPLQPRKYFDEEALNELASSIREHGIIQPLIVSKIEKETEFGTQVEYQLIAGERRLLASKLAGLDRVPTIIRRVSGDAENLELAIIENLQRSDLNPIEAARAYARLQDEFRLTQREIAVKMGKSREVIANAVRLLNLPSEIQRAIENGKVNESQARILLSITNPIELQKIFLEILEGKLSSVRAIKDRTQGEKKPIEPMQIDPEISGLENRLSEYFGTKVNIEKSDKGGKIVINFYSPEEIFGIVEKIQKEEE